MAKSKSKIQTAQDKTAVKEPNQNIQPSNYWQWIAIAVILIITYGLYRPAIHHEFVNWDDQVYVEEQKLVLKKDYSTLMSTPISLNYHPLTMISLAMQAPDKAQKLSAGPFIHLNIWLHILNTLLVFLFINMLTKNRWGVALFTAAVFALHPMHVESVAWVSERKDVLYTFFFLGACITYWQYKMKSKSIWLILTMILFLCSVLSKAMAVVFPVIMLLMDYWAGDNMKMPKTYLRHIAFFAVSTFFGLMAVNVQSGGDFGGILSLPLERSAAAVASFETFSIGKRLLIASVGFVEYIKGFFFPFEISAFYPYPPKYTFSSLATVIYPLITIGIFVATLWSLRRTKAGVFGLLFYCITVALVLQFLSVGLALMADRYTYLPFIGIAFAIAYIASDYSKTSTSQIVKYILPILGILFCSILAFKTSSQVGVWKNSESLWTQVLKYHPTEDLALANRGNYRGKSGKIAEAIQDLEKAIADGCNRSDVYDGLGNGYGMMGSQNPDQQGAYAAKAKPMYIRAMELDPSNSNIPYNLGISQLQIAPLEALKAFQKSLSLSPHKELDILPMIGLCQLNGGLYQDAINTTTTAMSKGINTDAIYYYRGLANLGLQKPSLAKEDFRQAITINPSNADARSRFDQMR